MIAENREELVITTNEAGECVCVSRQNEDGLITKIIWEAPDPVSISSRQAAAVKFLLDNGYTWKNNQWKHSII